MKHTKRYYKDKQRDRFLGFGKPALIAAFFLLCITSYAQNPALKVFEDWNTVSGTQNMFQRSVTRSVPGTSNVVIAGATVNSNGDYDMFVQKINGSGTVLWSSQYNGVGNGDDVATDIRVASNGEIYVCGAYYKDATDSSNAIVIKYDANGNQRWTAVYNGGGSRNDGYASMMVSGNSVVAVGTCWSSSNQYDMLTRRLDTAGATIWTATYDDSGLADGAISLSARTGFLYVAGGVQSASTSYKIATWKINPTTGAIATTTLSSSAPFGIDLVADVQEDASGNVYVAGSVYDVATGFDYKVFKYDANLSLLWSATWDGAASLDDGITGLVIDPFGRVIVTGYSTTTSQEKNFVTVKYSSTGSQLWASSFDGAASKNDSATAIVVGDTNHIYVTGYSDNGSTKDYHTIRYNSAGTELWDIGFNSIHNAHDVATAIALDTSGNVIVTGQNEISPVTRTYTTVKYIEKNTMVPQDTIAIISNSFVYMENRGQLIGTDAAAHPEIRFYTMHGYPNIYLADTSVSYVFAKLDTSAANDDTLTRVDMKFVNANTGLHIRSLNDARSEYSNFFQAHIPDGRCRVQNYNQLVSFGVWNGVDMVYSSSNEGMKYYFVCKPVGGGGSAGSIHLKYEGADSIVVGGSGELIIYTPQGIIVQPKAAAWQLDGSGNFSGLAWQPTYNKIGTNEITFTNFGTYTTSQPLVFGLDWGPPPTPFHINSPEWSMYFGGNGDDEGTGVTTDTDGNPYFVGLTASMDFPIWNGMQSAPGGSIDAFIAKFGSANGASQGTVLGADQQKWTTFYGGSNDDKAFGVVTDGNGATGRIYITGQTGSSDFPTFNNAGLYYQTTLMGTSDAFIVGFDNLTGGNVSNNTTVWASYFGGNGYECGNAIAKDGNGHIYMAGISTTTAYSSTTCGVPADNGFPTCNTTNNFDNGGAYGGGVADGFVTEFDNTGSLQWSSYYGGPNRDEINDISVIPGGVIYVTGHTAGGTGFPLSVFIGAYNQTTFGGGTYDAFLGKFKTGAHIWCTYYGGSGDDKGLALVTDASNNVFMAGETSSSTPACTTSCMCTVPATGEFPMCTPAGSYFQGTGNLGVYGGGTSDGFISKFDNAGVLGWSTYYGGNSTDRINDLDVDYIDQIYFTGMTASSSPAVNLASTAPSNWYWMQGSLNGTSDAFLGFFDASQARIWSDYYSNYLGITNDEVGNSIAAWATGPFNSFWYMTGATNTPLDFHTMAFNGTGYCCPNAFVQGINAGGYDAILTRFSAMPMFMEVEDMDAESTLEALVYPNPAMESVTINMALPTRTGITIGIYSITGELVYEQQYGQQADRFTAQVDFSAYANGMYVLQIRTDDAVVSKKVIKQK